MLAAALAGCRGASDTQTAHPPRSTLTLGFGLATGQDPERGVQAVLKTAALEGLVSFQEDGRPRPVLAASWSVSPDNLHWRFKLRSGVKFHDGTRLTASIVRDTLLREMPQLLGPVCDGIDEIRVTADDEFEIQLHRPCSLLLDALDQAVELPGKDLVGTGPFAVVSSGDTGAVLRANDDYWDGQPGIAGLVVKPYPSVRSAWADLLRDRVDMLYEVGTDAAGFLEHSSQARILTFRRSYAYVILLNMNRRKFSDSAVRRTLNSAIDRKRLVADFLNGHGEPADGPLSHRHWAYDPGQPHFEYQPRPIAANHLSFTCIIADPSHERLAIEVQQQLQAVGVTMDFELLPLDKALAKVEAGDFDALMADIVIGPPLVRPYWFWHSKAPFNSGHYASPQVDAALDAVRDAPGDDGYRTGVAAFQRAIADDPPAIFLISSERSLAASTRFQQPAELGRDPLSTLWLWRPTGTTAVTGPN